MAQIQVTLAHVNTTKNTYRFEECDTNGRLLENASFNPYAKIGVLYIKQRAFNGGGAPAKIKVTIEAV